MAKETNKNAKAFALEAAKVAEGLHCTDIVVLDLKGKSPATDYFVIATGTSARQMRTVADEICVEAPITSITVLWVCCIKSLKS